MTMSFDASELRRLSSDLMQVTPEVVGKLGPIVTKGAQNIKKAMQADASKSRHFRQLAGAVGYDVSLLKNGMDSAYEAEIGYGGTSAAPLAGIAIFGSSRPGGGTVRNPEEALNDEAPAFEQWISAAVDGLL